jgi:Tfp pilus assembly protein PilV
VCNLQEELMRNMICKNEKGISLVESIVSILLLSLALVAILSMQPTAMQSGLKSDYLGRAVMVLNKELMTQEAWIMNPCNNVTVGTPAPKTVYTSYQTTQQQGDATFIVQTTTTAVAGSTNTWKVTITVSWPPINTTGITDSLIVTRQESFRFGCV